MNERLGTELSPEALQVIAEARGVDDPTPEDEARVKARWLAGIAAGAGVSSLSEAVRAAASTGWGLKVGALVAALAAATAGVYLGWPQLSQSSERTATSGAVGSRSRAAPAPEASPQAAAVPSTRLAAPEVIPEPPSAREEGASRAAAPSEPARVEDSTPPEAAAAPTARPSEIEPPEAHALVPVRGPAVAHRTAAADRASAEREKAPTEPAPAPAALAPSGQLGEEIALLSEIRANLRAGAAARALQQLVDYRRRFGQPNLAMEADALQVDALCGAGQRDAARAAAAAFTSNWPSSPLQQRVSAACP